MAANVMELILLVFKSEEKAGEALKKLQEDQKSGLIKILDSATLKKDENGKG